jgi:hypothetical protein
VALWEGSALVLSNDFAGADLSWLTAAAGVKCEFASICYHTAQAVPDVQNNLPQDQFDSNALSGFPGSDERHMNMALAEVLPIADFGAPPIYATFVPVAAFVPAPTPLATGTQTFSLPTTIYLNATGTVIGYAAGAKMGATSQVLTGATITVASARVTRVVIK